MAQFGLKIAKSEEPDKTPYTVYYPHSKPYTDRKWTQDYVQLVSIDPGRKNYAFRIERRYYNGWITPVAFAKADLPVSTVEGDTTTTTTYQSITEFLNRYQQFYHDCHYIIIERQLPQNYKATRIAQHTISYFSLRLENAPLLPAIVEVSPHLKGKVLGAPRGLPNKALKEWAVGVAHTLLQTRRDDFSLGIINANTKQDDLSDTVCQAEALLIAWGYPATKVPPPVGTTAATPAITRLAIIPAATLSLVEDEAPPPSIRTQILNIVDLLQTAPTRAPVQTLTLKIQPQQQ
jgi:hypothetical protein